MKNPPDADAWCIADGIPEVTVIAMFAAIALAYHLYQLSRKK
jgi:hypothetical protein